MENRGGEKSGKEGGDKYDSSKVLKHVIFIPPYLLVFSLSILGGELQIFLIIN